MNRAYTPTDVVNAGWAPSVHYLVVRLRRGEIRGRKVGRDWRMSEDDVEYLIEHQANRPAPKPIIEQRAALGLSAASARRRSA